MKRNRKPRGVLPTAEEINDHSIDGPCAEKHFLGVTLTEAQRLFEKDSLTYLEDLSVMPSAGFAYYFPAAIAYFLSPAATDDPIAVSSFLGSFELRLDSEREGLEDSIPSLRDALMAIRDDWDRFFIPDDPETVSLKAFQKREAWQIRTRDQLLRLIDRLEQASGRRKPGRGH